MTLPQLYYIAAVDTYRHFSTAASHCFVTQPTLSTQIQKLEEELGVIIFDRSRQPIVPTETGEKIIRQAKIIITESERLREIISNDTGEYSGVLKIGVIPTVAPYLIPLFIKNFVNKYPNIDLVIDEVTTKEITSGLNKGSINAGILALPINNPDFTEISLYQEPFVAYVSRNNPLFKKELLELRDLTRDDILLLKEGHCLRDQILKICSQGEKELKGSGRKILFESGNLDTIKKLVEQDFGFTLLPYLAVSDIISEDQKQLIREFKPPVPKREIGLLYNKSSVKSSLIKLLKKEITEVIPVNLLTELNSLIIK